MGVDALGCGSAEHMLSTKRVMVSYSATLRGRTVRGPGERARRARHSHALVAALGRDGLELTLEGSDGREAVDVERAACLAAAREVCTRSHEAASAGRAPGGGLTLSRRPVQRG